MSRTPDPHRLVTVHAGPAWDVELLAMQLDGAGIDSFQPDKMTKTVDPFITGPNPLSSRLQVRVADAEQATKIIEEARERLKPDPLGDDDDEEDDDDSEEEAGEPADEVEWLATRTRWAALMGITLPFAILSGWLYLKACRAYGRRSRFHGLTLAAFALSIVACVLPLAWLVVFEVVPSVLE